MINGRKFNWESITITTPWGVLIDVTDINYKSSRGITRLKGKGGQTTGLARKGVESDGDLKIRREEFQMLLAGMPGGVLGDTLMTITVSGTVGGATFTDTLPDCLFEEVSTGSSVDDEDIKVSLNLWIGSPILWDGKSPFLDAV